MNIYEIKDQALTKHREKKIAVAQKISGVGFHEMLKILYDGGMKQHEIIKKINKVAGEIIVADSSIYWPLSNIGCIERGVNKGKRQKRRHTPRVRARGVVYTGLERECLQCGEIFKQTNVNHARCTECTKSTLQVTEYYAVNRAGGN